MLTQRLTRFRAPACLALALLAGCEQAPEEAPEPLKLPEVPTANATRYSLDPTTSRFTLRVYRDGPMAGLGHNHVVTMAGVEGEIYRRAPITASGLKLRIPTDGLVLDRTEDRAAAGKEFSVNIAPVDKDKARRTMLGPEVLNAEVFPHITVHSVAITGEAPDIALFVRVKLRDLVTEWRLPAKLTLSSDAIVAVGSTTLSYQRLGLQPFTAMDGGLWLKDEMGLHYHLVAQRAD